jgi:non-canonical (house-cleaning) NTP pyrophosphatase
LTQYVINIEDTYEVPQGPLNNQQYVVFVMNRAAESYRNQYNTLDFETGITAARTAYNDSLPEEIINE